MIVAADFDDDDGYCLAETDQFFARLREERMLAEVYPDAVKRCKAGNADVAAAAEPWNQQREGDAR